MPLVSWCRRPLPRIRCWHPQHLAVEWNHSALQQHIHRATCSGSEAGVSHSSCENRGLVNCLCPTLMSTFQVTYRPATWHHFIKPFLYFTAISSARHHSPTLFPTPGFSLSRLSGTQSTPANPPSMLPLRRYCPHCLRTEAIRARERTLKTLLSVSFCT